jgi:hypothetical protein
VFCTTQGTFILVWVGKEKESRQLVILFVNIYNKDFLKVVIVFSFLILWKKSEFACCGLVPLNLK